MLTAGNGAPTEVASYLTLCRSVSGLVILQDEGDVIARHALLARDLLLRGRLEGCVDPCGSSSP